MSVPAKRLSSRHRKTRASHHALAKVTTTTCSKCKKLILPHTACKFCGYYKGKSLKTAKPASKKTAKVESDKKDQAVTEKPAAKK